ncbi:MAG: TolC family protein [Bacteroidia bacterium]|nr:TolC family protein [Bacteroidia bacterium]
MKLANIHKHIVVIFLLIGLQSAHAQNWSLQQCLDTARVYNKNLQMSKNNLDIGEQKKKEAQSNLLPKIAANSDYKYFTNLPYQLLPLNALNPAAPVGEFRAAQFGVPHNLNANITLSMPLYNPQVFGAIQSTKIASELADWQYQKTEEQIFFEIYNLYYNAQILHHQLAFIDSNLINATRILTNMQLLNEQLLAKGSDVDKLKLQVSQLTSQKVTIQGKYEQVLNALKFAMGISIQQAIQIAPDVVFNEYQNYKLLVSKEYHINKMQNRLLLNDLSILNKSRYLPSIQLIGLYGTSGFGYTEKPNSFFDFYPIGFAGIQLNYPLFAGTTTQRKINQKKIELRIGEIKSQLINEQNTLQIQNSELQRNLALKLVQTAKEQINLAKTIYEQTILQQKYGTANLTDVLLADNALREAQQIFLNTVVEYLKANLEMKKLTGNL